MKKWISKWALATAGVLVGALLLSPVAAHVNNNFSHLWNDHIKPKADQRYVQRTKSPWARVAANGNLIAGEGVVDINNAPAGEYTIEFNRKVGAKCAGTATSWTEDLIASIQMLENRRFVDVELINTANTNLNGAFSVMFRC